jgi:hypothetical protein
MNDNQAFQEALASIYGSVASETAPTGLARAGIRIAQSPFAAVANASESVGNIMGLKGEQGYQEVAKPTPLPETGRGVDTFTDVALGGFLPMAEEIMATGALGRLAGIGKIASPVLRNAAQGAVDFGFLGAQQDRVTGVEQAAEGFGYGLASGLGRFARLPVAAGLAYGSKAFFDRNGDTPVMGGYSQGDISGGLGFLTSMLPGKTPFRAVRPVMQDIPDHFAGFATVAKEEASAVPTLDPNISEVHPDVEHLLGTVTQPSDYVRQPVSAFQQLEGIFGPDLPPTSPVGHVIPPDPRVLLGGTGDVGAVGGAEPALGNAFQSARFIEDAKNAAESRMRFEVAKENGLSIPYEPAGGGGPGNPELLDYLSLAAGKDAARSAEAMRAAGGATRVTAEEIRGQFPEVPANTFRDSLIPSETIITPETGLPANLLNPFEQPAPSATAAFEGLISPSTDRPLPSGPRPDYMASPIDPLLRKAKGKIPDVPEWMREARLQLPGNTPLTRGAFGALTGYVAGDQSGAEHPEMSAIALGLGAAFGPAALARVAKLGRPFSSEVGGIFAGPAFKLANGEIRTKPGATAHWQILQDLDADSLVNPGTVDGFVTNEGKFVTREEAHQMALEASPAYKARMAQKDMLHRGEPRTYMDSQQLDLANEAKVVSSGIQNKDVVTFAETLAEKAAKRAEEMKSRIVPSGLKKGDTFTAKGSGRTYEFISDAPAASSGPNKGKPRIYMRDPFTGDEASFLQEGIENLQPLQKPSSNAKNKIGGFVSDETQNALGKISLGAFVGGLGGAMMDDPGEHKAMAAGAAIGALGAVFGPALISHLAAPKAPGAAPRVKAAGFEEFSTPRLIAEAKQAVFNNKANLLDKAVVRATEQLNLNHSEQFKRVLGDSKGPVSTVLRQFDSALHKLGNTEVDKAFQDATGEFLTGAIPEADLLALAVNNPQKAAYASFAIDARQAINSLQELSKAGQGNAAHIKIIDDSIGKYVRQSYRLFIDKKYVPSDVAVANLAARIHTNNLWQGQTIPEIQTALRQYAKDIQEIRGMYSPKQGTSTSIDQTLFKNKKVLDTEMKQFLGEITDPVERARLTVMKLKPMAEASGFLSQIAKGVIKSDEGLPLTFSDGAQKEALRQQILHQLQTDPTNNQLRAQAAALDLYRFVSNENQNGALRNLYVHDTVHEVMASWEKANKADSAASRAFVGLNQFMKSNVTYRNPIATIRQVLSAPFFMQIGRANWSDIPEAMAAMRDTAHPMYKELTDRGITNVDVLTRDVFRDMDLMSGSTHAIHNQQAGNAFMGRIDKRIADVGLKLKNGDLKMADWFRYADNLTRATTYISAKNRIAKALGKAIDDPEVANRAVEFTNRYTMNYEHLPTITKTGRQVPFVNMFLSYTSEMTRILKNVGEDLIKGDAIGGPGARLNAAMALGTMVALPEIAQTISESNLSAKDKQDWDKTKKNLPSYLKNRFYVNIKRDPKTKQFTYWDIDNMLPASAFQQTVRALASGDFKDAAANNPVFGFDNNPALNVTTTLIMGRDRNTGREVRGPEGYFASIAKDLGGPLTPGTGSVWRNFEKAFSPNDQGGQGITDRYGRTLSPGEFVSTLLPVRAGHLALDQQEQYIVNDFKRSVSNELAYMNDVVKSNHPQATKERAIARARSTIQALKERMESKLGIATKE